MRFWFFFAFCESKRYMTKFSKFSKLRIPTVYEKPKFFWLAHLPHTIFSIRINLQNYRELCPTREHAKNFSFFVFSPFFWTRKSLNLGAKKTSLRIEHLPLWYRWLSPHQQYSFWYVSDVRTRIKEIQDLHIPKYSHFHPSILAWFLHFFSITCCKWIF